MTRALEKALLQHFIQQKLEIAYAINKPFPFFEGLRDNFFITERLYRESMEACENLVPLSRVVYNILTQLEKTFSLSFLKILFSQINLNEYPNLITTLNSFTRVVTSHGGWSRITTTLLEAPANPAGRSSPRTLLLPRLPCRQPLRSLPPCGPSVSERAPAQRSSEVLRELPSRTGLTMTLRETIQKGRLSPVSSDSLTPQIKDKEDTQEMPCTSSDPVPVKRDDVPEPSDPKELQEASRTLPSKKGKKRKRCIWATSKKRQQKNSHQGSKMRKQEGAGGQRQLIPVDQGAALPGHGIQKTLQGLDQVTHTEDDSIRNTKVMTRTQKRRTECAQMPKSEEISDNTSEMDEGKRSQEPPSTPPRITHGKDSMDDDSKLSLEKSPGKKQKKRKIHNWSSSKKRQKKCLSKGAASSGLRIQEKLQGVNQVTQKKDDSTRKSTVMTRARKAQAEGARMPAQKDKAGGGTGHLNAQRGRVSHGARTEKPKDKTIDFHSPELPVTCGEAKGILYKEKMKQGSSKKCIQNEKGVWFTPTEFEIEGKRKHSRNWKHSVFCGGKSLGKLLQNGILFCPSRKHLKTEENSKECAVCCKGGSLLRCDTCPRFFHEDCHIPPAEAERSPWSCTFCRMKESSGNQQGLQESEVWARSMQLEEQLKCEFLLLKAYCHPQSSFFAETPCNIRDYGEPFREAMWLDLVKERLTEKVYTMAWFLRDMRLIFHNHKTFYKVKGISCLPFTSFLLPSHFWDSRALQESCLVLSWGELKKQGL
ncbi:sp110 nuclear body protein isoform X2 [Bos taurus]|uniref:sp110 nuclear body protein isoform X2 n=1 Tax=Bos taurus TaxID=9913 RepID=UPI000383CACC|nr:sp110 nuclear body protein isoform X2 [Bos taurus]